MVTTWTVLSNTPFLRTAVAMPRGTAMIKVSSMDSRLSITVFIIGVPMTLTTCCLY